VIPVNKISVSMLPRSFFTSMGFFQKPIIPMVSYKVSTTRLINRFRCGRYSVGTVVQSKASRIM